MNIEQVQFSDDAKTGFFPEEGRTLTEREVECLWALGFKSVLDAMKSYALKISERDTKIVGLESALAERRFNQSQHKELRDEWAMQVYQKDGRSFQECYAEADKAMVTRVDPNKSF